MVVDAFAGSCETGCWKNLLNACVRLTGKDGMLIMMFVVVRHGQDFYCKAHV
jgi:hypothetical protein